MIDFRYHVVSLTAVFLAIALGVFVGATVSGTPAAGAGRVAELERDQQQLADRTRALDAQLATADGFEQAIAPAVLGGTLPGRGVLLVATGEDVPAELVEQVGSLITEAGGTVTGVVRLQPAYTDPASATGLRTYVTSPGIPAGIQLPATDDAGQLVAGLLGSSLMIPADGAAAPDPAAASAVLAGLAALDVLTVESPAVTPASHAVVLTAAGSDSDDAAERNGTVLELVGALDAAGSGAVLAGTADSADGSGLVAAVRSDAGLAGAVSTVDNVERAAGRIAAVLALGQEATGASGAYGTGEGTRPVPPLPAAAP